MERSLGSGYTRAVLANGVVFTCSLLEVCQPYLNNMLPLGP
jgi:hypothetical protein